MSDTTGSILWELRSLYKEAVEDESPESRDSFMDQCYIAMPRVLSELDYMYGMLTTTNPKYTVNVLNGKTFSFRAECQYNIDALRQNLVFERRVFTLDAVPLPLCGEGGTTIAVPDMAATLVIDMPLENLRNIMRLQEDSHVMVQSLRECPLDQNSLERDRRF